MCPDQFTITCLFCYSNINSSPPRATPPRNHDPGRPARHPHHDMHPSDRYAVVIGNLNKHKCPTTSCSRPDIPICPFTHPLMVKYVYINAWITPDPTTIPIHPRGTPLFPITHPFQTNYLCITIELHTPNPTTSRCSATSHRARRPNLGGALSSNGSPGLPLPRPYIYSLYIKSTGLPIIEEAHASQYAHLVELDLVSIYTVTAPLPLFLRQRPTSPPFLGFQNRLRAINREKPARVQDSSFCIRRTGRKPLNPYGRGDFPCGRGDLPGDFCRSNPAVLLQSPNLGAPIEEPLLSWDVPGNPSNLKYIEVSVDLWIIFVDLKSVWLFLLVFSCVWFVSDYTFL
jgi:hypothetical protein